MPSRRLPQTTELARHLYPLARVTRGETLYYWHRSSGILYCYTWTIATIPCLITRILYISSVSRAQRMSEREKLRDFEHEPSLFDLLSASSIPQRTCSEGGTIITRRVITTRIYGGQEPRSGALAADNADRSGQTSVMRTTPFNSWLFGVVAEGHCLLCGAWLSQARIPTACTAKIP